MVSMATFRGINILLLYPLFRYRPFHYNEISVHDGSHDGIVQVVAWLEV